MSHDRWMFVFALVSSAVLGLFLAALLIGYGLIGSAEWLDVPPTPVPASPALFAVSASSGALAAVDPLACADAVAVELRLRQHDRDLRRLRARLDACRVVCQ